MSSSKHTLGPWKVMPEEVDRSYIRIRGDVPRARFKVANVLTPMYHGAGEREAEETRANARLIAAAPDLLAAMRTLVEAAEERGLRTDEAKAAIAKATGGAA